MPERVHVTTPGGASVAEQVAGDTVLIDLEAVEEGRYAIALSNRELVLETAFSVLRQAGDLGSDIILVLAPEPCPMRPSEALVVGISEGNHIHRLFTVALEGPDDAAPREEVALVHTHFREAFNIGDFLPMANQAPVAFSAPGAWKVDVLIHGGVPESASFTVEVPDH